MKIRQLHQLDERAAEKLQKTLVKVNEAGHAIQGVIRALAEVELSNEFAEDNAYNQQ